MAFNPFDEEKTAELTKKFRQDFQVPNIEKQIEIDEDDTELSPAQLINIEFINQMNNSADGIGEQERYVQRKLNKHARAHGCGRKAGDFKTNNTFDYIVWKCGDYRLCPYCRRKRIEELTNALIHHRNALSYDEYIRFKEIPESEYDMYSKRAQREGIRYNEMGGEIKFKYGKINRPNSKLYFFSNGEDDSWGEELRDYTDYDDQYNQINWMEVLAEIPEDTKISGSIWRKPGIGKDEKDKNSEDEVKKELVAITRVITNATEREEQLAAYKAIADTQVNITSIEELQKALFDRVKLYTDNVGEDKCHSFIDYVWFSENDIALWNSTLTVPKSYIKNKDIHDGDNRTPTKELTPAEQFALVT